jgi:hypothetical protein
MVVTDPAGALLAISSPKTVVAIAEVDIEAARSMVNGMCATPKGGEAIDILGTIKIWTTCAVFRTIAGWYGVIPQAHLREEHDGFKWQTECGLVIAHEEPGSGNVSFVMPRGGGVSGMASSEMTDLAKAWLRHVGELDDGA